MWYKNIDFSYHHDIHLSQKYNDILAQNLFWDLHFLPALQSKMFFQIHYHLKIKGLFQKIILVHNEINNPNLLFYLKVHISCL